MNMIRNLTIAFASEQPLLRDCGTQQKSSKQMTLTDKNMSDGVAGPGTIGRQDGCPGGEKDTVLYAGK